MSDYYLIKRDVCERCSEGQIEMRHKDKPDEPRVVMQCHECDGLGYIGTPVDLLDVLAKVRWTNGALDFGSPNKLGNNLRIEE